MGILNLNLEQFTPSSLKGKTPSAIKTPIVPAIRPTSVSSIPRPAPVSSQTPIKMKTPENKSFMMKAFEALALPSELTEKFLTKGQGYEKSIENLGIKNKTAQKVGGFAGKMILDPLNFLPVGKMIGTVGKGIKGLGFVDDTLKLAGKIPLPKLGFESGVLKTGLTSVDDVARNLGEKFIPNFGKPELYGAMKKQIPTSFGIGAEKIMANVKTIFKDVKPEEYKIVASVLNQIPFIKGRAVRGNIIQLAAEVGEDRFKNVIMPVVRKTQEIFRGELDDLVTRGRLDAETAKKFISRGGYYPHLDFAPESIKKYFSIPQFAEKRGYLKARRGTEGFTMVAPKAIAKRELNQLQDNIVQDFLTNVKNQFGVQLGKGKTMPNGFVDFIDAPKRLKVLNGWALPENIAKDITASFDATNPLGYIGKGLDTFNRLWKPTATSMNPAFHFINIIGNMYNSWLGGLKDPRRFIQAIKGGFNDAERIVLEKSGILSRGQFGADLVARTFENPEGLDTLKLFEPFRRLGNFFENNARSAFFLDQRGKFLKEGLSEVEATSKAIGKVNEYLFDYLTGLTPFETNVMRRVFPFYTWARFNIPLQFKSIITQPEKVAVVSKVYKALNAGGVPESDQEGITIPTPFTDADGNPIRYKPNLPIQDIFQLMRRPMDMLSPLLKEGGELGHYALSTLAGKPKAPTDWYTGAERTNVNLPFRTQVGDIIKSEAQSVVRPFRAYTRTQEEGFSPSSLLRQATGGFYSVKQKQYDIQKIQRKNAINSATLNRVRKIRLDNTLTPDEKKSKIDFLMQYKRE